MVDMIKFARRRAGMSVALNRVFPPTAFLIVGLYVYAILFAKQQDKNAAIVVAGWALLLTPILLTLGYFLGRRSVKLLRRELEGVIDAEQVILALHESVASALATELEDLTTIFREEFLRRWYESGEAQRSATMRTYGDGLKELRERQAKLTPRMKIRNQEHSLRLERLLQDAENRIATLQATEIPPPSEEAIQEAMAASAEFMSVQRLRLEKERDAELEKAAQAIRTIAEAENALHELK